jgi:hypothetical protein
MADEAPLDEPGAPAPPPFDKEAARRRYRATMRGPLMRWLMALLALIILASWGFGIAAAIATDVERLPGHDQTVPPRQCVACHSQPSNGAPALPHPVFPSCGFCHRQSPPTPIK